MSHANIIRLWWPCVGLKLSHLLVDQLIVVEIEVLNKQPLLVTLITISLRR